MAPLVWLVSASQIGWWDRPAGTPASRGDVATPLTVDRRQRDLGLDVFLPFYTHEFGVGVHTTEQLREGDLGAAAARWFIGGAQLAEGGEGLGGCLGRAPSVA